MKGYVELAQELKRDRFTPAAAIVIAAFGVLGLTRPAVSTAQAANIQAVSTVQPMGTVHAGPDGDWVLKRSSRVSYAQQAQVRYQCDIRAVDQTGFDPTADDGGVSPEEFIGKRTEYLRAELACFQSHGYILR